MLKDPEFQEQIRKKTMETYRVSKRQLSDVLDNSRQWGSSAIEMGMQWG